MTAKADVTEPAAEVAPIDLPLRGVRVLELAQLVPAALVTRWLADLGAEVLKVEEAGRGDGIRHIPPFVDGVGVVQALSDRGKCSLELGLRSGEGTQLLRELAEEADVVVEGARPGGAERVGLDLSELRRRRPEVVVCSITGFGRQGPLTAIPAHGMTIDSLAGIADVQLRGGQWSTGSKFASTIGVELGALQAVIGILSALMNVRSGGEGAWLDVSMWDAAVEMNRYNVALGCLDGGESMSIGDSGAAYAIYETGDQRLVLLCAIENKFWDRFCRAVERPDLIDRASTNGTFRLGSDGAGLGQELAEIFKGRPAHEWTRLFERHDIPGNVVLDVRDVVTSPQFSARRISVGTVGKTRIPNVLNPIMWVGASHRLGEPLAPAPALGEGGLQLAHRWLGRESSG